MKPQEHLLGWLDAQIMSVESLPFFTESQKQESEMLVSRYQKVRKKIMELFPETPVSNTNSDAIDFVEWFTDEGWEYIEDDDL